MNSELLVILIEAKFLELDHLAKHLKLQRFDCFENVETLKNLCIHESWEKKKIGSLLQQLIRDSEELVTSEEASSIPWIVYQRIYEFESLVNKWLHQL